MTTRVPPRRNAVLPLLIGLMLIALLVGLGTWQVRRRAWKLDLIARVERHLHAAPVPAPGPAAWPRIGAGDAYLRVRARGRFMADRITLVRAVTTRGPGFWMMTPLADDRGFTLLVNRGFVPEERASSVAWRAGTTEVEVTGLLRLTEPKGGFLRANDPRANHWYSRDVAAIAQARGLGPVAPYFIDADADPHSRGYPIGGMTVIAFRNNHLQYALTWYGLAILTGWAMWRFVRIER